MTTRSKQGQLSIELIIILAILLGVVFLVASKMRESAGKASESIGNTSDRIYGEIENMTTQAPAGTKEITSINFDKAINAQQSIENLIL